MSRFAAKCTVAPSGAMTAPIAKCFELRRSTAARVRRAPESTCPFAPDLVLGPVDRAVGMVHLDAHAD